MYHNLYTKTNVQKTVTRTMSAVGRIGS